MAVPANYLSWSREKVNQRVHFMRRMRTLNKYGMLFWYPLNNRGLSRDEIKTSSAFAKKKRNESLLRERGESCAGKRKACANGRNRCVPDSDVRIRWQAGILRMD